ncbi:uncharacterized protein F5Z01DRAFT_638690 [Emericellopsis atlantica]|uniref:Rhodopsin domain-containing protein n=1 Tax=Emericellopsis atlantica TaxID=2614577 RepID=A0A9P7ZHQ5_9HYPO|nr:uncharacterized protein F5Z01DRAFT_638690 [Emericellopsis atlantica]KAG9252052.1 hypothetical protein F5Z01DRAFT_638690 [Emericellopsis atlantica]
MTGVSKDGENAIIIVYVLTTVATICAAMRFKIRWHGQLGADDYLLAFSLVLIWLQAVGNTLLAVKGGMGRPMATLSEGEIEWLFKMFYAPEIGYTLLTGVLKLSILLSYKRIFGHMRKILVYIHVLMGLAAGWLVSCLFVIIFQCWPIHKVWKPLTPGGCIDLLAFLWATSVSNFIIDWLILSVPLIPIWKLQMTPIKKVFVAGSFALGSIACITSTVRAAVTGTIDVTDMSKSVFMASIWTYIEPTVAIVSACLPFFSKFFTEKVRNIGTKGRSMGNKYSKNGSDFEKGEGHITKKTTTTVSGESRGVRNQHELVNYSVRVGATPDGHLRLHSDSSTSLV